MSQWIERISKITQRTKNAIRALGPLLIAQSDKASEAFQRHLARASEAAAFGELLKTEVQLRAAVRRTLLERYVVAPDAERVRIERDLEYVDGKVRLLNIVSKSVLYDQRETAVTSAERAPKVIAEHWLDRFNELARLRNEDWRGELLARAFATEASVPGTVSPRLLWLIGNMEWPTFEALGTLLDLCIWFEDEHPFIPETEYQINVYGLRSDASRDAEHVGDSGLVADGLFLTIDKGEEVVVRYGESAYKVRAKTALEINGVMLTPIGEAMAQFYESQPNRIGQKVFEEWRRDLRAQEAFVRPIKKK